MSELELELALEFVLEVEVELELEGLDGLKLLLRDPTLELNDNEDEDEPKTSSLSELESSFAPARCFGLSLL